MCYIHLCSTWRKSKERLMSGAKTKVWMFTSVCLQFERKLKWKLRTNNQCLIIISQHACRLVFIPLSVYCESLILACVCYATAITGWCVLILNFCPSYFLLLSCLSSSQMFPAVLWNFFAVSMWIPSCKTVKRMTYLSHASSATLSFHPLFLPRPGRREGLESGGGRMLTSAN